MEIRARGWSARGSAEATPEAGFAGREAAPVRKARSLLRLRPERRSGPLPLTFPGPEPARVQPSRLDEEMWPLLAAVFVVDRKEDSSLVKGL